MTQILLAAPVRKKIIRDLKKDCADLKSKNIVPFLKVILVGKNPASLVYTSNKKKFCEKIGAQCEIVALDENITESSFQEVIKDINEDKNVHGCIIQLPLPKHLTHIDVGTLISKEKDVDGFHPENLYAILQGKYNPTDFISCTPKGVITLLKEYKIELTGKNIVVIGRSMIVGKPLSLLLINEDATVTVCHSKTYNLKDHTKKADIIVCAIGKPKFLTAEYLNDQKSQIVIDVGINNDENGELCGDADYANIVNQVAAITPVPGGVGPMTIASLVQNLLQAAKKEISI